MLVVLGLGLIMLLCFILSLLAMLEDATGPAVVFALGMIATGVVMGVTMDEHLEAHRAKLPVPGAWCTDGGGTYHPHGTSDFKFQLADGGIAVVNAPVCVYPN